MAETRTGRLVARHGFGVRIPAPPWSPDPSEHPPAPVDLIGQIAPIPILIVHGELDSYLPVDHPRALAAAAGPTARLWLVPGFGHAEAGVFPGLVDRMGRYLRCLLDGHRPDSAFEVDNSWETSVKHIGTGPGQR
jgi:pimeloyl-ACP methyl ester carboxylesterase